MRVAGKHGWGYHDYNQNCHWLLDRNVPWKSCKQVVRGKEMNNQSCGNSIAGRYKRALVLILKPNEDFSQWYGECTVNGTVVATADGSAQMMLDLTEEALLFLIGADGKHE
jgi:hypothetical protein